VRKRRIRVDLVGLAPDVEVFDQDRAHAPEDTLPPRDEPLEIRIHP